MSKDNVHPGRLALRSIQSGWTQQLFRRIQRLPSLPSYRAYNLTVSHQSRFVWFRVPKVATRSIIRVLREHSDLDVDQASAVYYPYGAYADYFKFAFVRNPWDRLVSAWHNQVVEGQSGESMHRDYAEHFGRFIDYIECLDIERCNVHWRLQSSLIDLNALTFMGRFESLGEDFAHVSSVIGLRQVVLPIRNTSMRGDWRRYYTDDQLERVGRIYSKDIQIFGYSVDA